MWHWQVFFKKGGPVEGHPDVMQTDLYAIHEYYPDIQNKAAWSKDAMTPCGETLDGLKNELENMLKDLKKYGVRDIETGELIE